MAEKMRYENEIENAKVDDEFNNSEEDLSCLLYTSGIHNLTDDVTGMSGTTAAGANGTAGETTKAN